VVLACAPIITVIGYETVGHQHLTDALTRLKEAGEPSRHSSEPPALS